MKTISIRKKKLLAKEIANTVHLSKQQMAYTANAGIVITYWQVGKLICDLESAENYDAVSLRLLLKEISILLVSYSLRKGFSVSNLFYMRLFYQKFTSVQTLSEQTKVLLKNSRINTVQTASERLTKTATSHIKNVSKKDSIVVVEELISSHKITISPKISWSHYIELLKCNHKEEIEFYLELCHREVLSIRELKSHISKALFERVAISKSTQKVKIKNSSIKGNFYDDFFRDPLTLDFLGINMPHKLTEKKIEQAILDNLQSFILEIGKGFAFVARQQRISIDGRNFYIDLVFYHIHLQCYILIDLKIDEVQHEDIGQMNFYLNYYKQEVKTANQSNPIGIILSRNKNQMTVEFALGGISNKIFVNKYQLHLPDKKTLEQKVQSFFK